MIAYVEGQYLAEVMVQSPKHNSENQPRLDPPRNRKSVCPQEDPQESSKQCERKTSYRDNDRIGSKIAKSRHVGLFTLNIEGHSSKIYRFQVLEVIFLGIK